MTPLDYVKQICFEQSQYYPIYFFINQTRAQISDVIGELEKVDCRPNGKAKLIARLKASEKLSCGPTNTTTEAGKRVAAIVSSLASRSLTDDESVQSLRNFFYALTHLAKNNADPDFILPLIQRAALPQYSSLVPLDAMYMRKAICHLDVIWYKRAWTMAADAAGTGQ